MPPESLPPSDADLGRRALAGESDAFTALVERYAPGLLRYARRLTRNDEDAQDIVQETLVRLHQNLAKLDFSDPLKPWLYRVCTNLCRNLAKRKRTIAFSDLESDEEDSSFVELQESQEPTPSEILLASVRAEVVAKAVAALPQKYQAVVALYYWEGLSYEEIADVLRIPINTVRTHLKRAKDRLGSSLSALV
ncbi:hypothetical protein COU80_00450 [Candidatus Peregrinibacteria bacterium CG10_big_fil_rev_8_21_14_0_10_55_24]|nr:MAG: hypothetical protein COU80_00450 [Candidatus Peregrinibacteria bacterium CG10_big_fil_rev_8_21_14_0_10_55_24]